MSMIPPDGRLGAIGVLSELDELRDNAMPPSYRTDPVAMEAAHLVDVVSAGNDLTNAFIQYGYPYPGNETRQHLGNVPRALARLIVQSILAIQHYTLNEEATYRHIQVAWTEEMKRAGL